MSRWVDAGAIVADCRQTGCVWRHEAASNLSGLRDSIEAMRAHCIAEHKGSCREIRVVIHQAGEACDHERPS